MAKLKVLEKRYDVLDVKDNCSFRINIDVLNEVFGVGRSMYARGVYPDKKNTYFSGTKPNEKFFVWMPKLYSNSSKWKNSISEDESIIYEIAEPTRTDDWMNSDSREAYRIVFVKSSPKAPYHFVGVFENYKMNDLNHSYKRIATKIRLIGDPVYKIEIINDSTLKIEYIETNELEEAIYAKQVNEQTIDEKTERDYVPKPEERKQPILIDGSQRYPRDPVNAKIALKLANYSCEFFKDHITFTRRSDGLPYTEAHHLIPMSYQNLFENSLDVPANIISLCSHCHNCVHYGTKAERNLILMALFSERKEILEKSGIHIKLDDLIKMYD